VPDFDQLINLTIDGRYRIYRRMGRGGLSTIFAATDLETDLVVVLKISDPAQMVRRDLSYSVDPAQARSYWSEMLERMRREAETLADIDHPNIVRLYGTGMINDDLRYVVMEFLRGRTLREEIDRNERIEISTATGIAIDIASALAEVHSRGIVHRDINPRNIMIADCGLRIADCGNAMTDKSSSQPATHNTLSSIKLIDFGIAKIPQPAGAPPFTQHSSLSGTVAYASPEQCSSQPVDHRTDIYSLGVVLYEMVTGERPFKGRTPTEIALKHIQSQPPRPYAINPAIPPKLERTILRSLAKNPDERQQSIEELTGELRGGLNQIVIPLPSTAIDEDAPTLSINRAETADQNGDDPAEEELKAIRRRRRRFTATAAAALLLATLTGALLFGKHLTSLRSRSAMMPENTAAISPLPDATFGSDADSLELAARFPSQTGVANPISSPSPSPTYILRTRPLISVSSNSIANDRIATRPTVHSPTPAPAPTPVTPKAHPQMPPPPSPNIANARLPQPESEPDASQAPRREDDTVLQQGAEDITGHRPNQNDNASNRPNRKADRDDDYDSIRNRGNDAGSLRHPPDHADRDDDEEDYSARIGPKLIQWSGYVRYEREITIEMPGVPGRVEIPRVYRDRVGVVEPPSASNRWQCVVLRVFGRGNVSIVIRWWPATSRLARLSARR
jgi:serine/threonine protein kinase